MDTSRPPFFAGYFTTAEIAAINGAVAGSAASYPAGSTLVNSETGKTLTLSGVGTAAAFTSPAGAGAGGDGSGVDGDGNSVSRPWYPVAASIQPLQAMPQNIGATQSNPYRTRVINFGVASINEFACAGAAPIGSIDTVDTFDGRPVSVMTLTSASTGTGLEVGTSGAVNPLPVEAASFVNKNIAVAIKTTQQVGQVALLVGDATYAATTRVVLTRSYKRDDGWIIFYGNTSVAGALTSSAGPTSGNARIKVTATLASGLWQPGVVKFAFASITAAPKPRVVLTFDDGHESWASYLWPALAERRLPASFGIDSTYLDTAGWLTSEQIKDALVRYPNIEFTNHAGYNESFVAVGLAKYMQNVDMTDAKLLSLGVPLVSRRLHQYVQGSYDASLINAMRARGYIACREVGAPDRSVYPLLAYESLAGNGEGNDGMYTLPAGCNLGSAQTVATVKAYIQNACSASKTFFVMGHNFGQAHGAVAWISGYDSGHGMSTFLDWLADERDAGRVDVVLWSEWVAMSKGVKAG